VLLLTTLATDGICRDNSRFTVGALAHALEQNWEHGIPSLVAHDMHRPVGWTLPTALYIARNGCRLTGQSQIATTEREVDDLRGAMTAFEASRLEASRDEINRLQTLIGDVLAVNALAVVSECASLYDSNLARHVVPSVFAEEDADGLIEIAKLQLIGPGVYRHGEFALFAHRYFRRTATPANTLNIPFLAALHKMPSHLRPRIALDPDMIGLASSYRPHLEHQYWWGPRFDDDLARIQPGVSQHGATDVERFFTGIERTDFRWGDRDGERIFEVEELRATRTFDLRSISYACRYAHSIVFDQGDVGHFDGAVRIYDDAAHEARRFDDIAHAGRASDYRKLWRLDGEIPVPVWKRLLSDYFRDNHLIGEYLGAAPAARFGPIPPPDENQTRRKDLPASFRIERGSGVRIGLSFRTLPEEPATLHIWPGKLLEIDGQRTPLVEADTLELVKLMAREGRRLEIDPATVLVAIEDMDINLATVWHPAPSEVPGTIQTIRRLADAYQQREEDRLLSFSVAYPVRAAAVILSISGHVLDIVEFIQNWMTEVQPILTVTERLADNLKRLVGDGAADDPQPDALASLTINRVLEIDRLELERGLYELKRVEQGVAIDLLLDPSDESYPVAEVEAGRVRPVAGVVIEESVCGACGQCYRDCPCSRVVDTACYQSITKSRSLSIYLTQRPA
jgi:hypothetical protein